MARFLSQLQIYRALQRELPPDVYPDGQASAFFSTADMASIADGLCTGYGNLARIYDNYFPQTTDESVDKWVEKGFIGTSFDATVSLQDKRDRVIAKVRKQPKISLFEVLKIAAGYVPAGTYVQILEGGSTTGSWRLGVSRLGKDTFLGFSNTPGDLNQAYSYFLRIFDFQVTGTSFVQMVRALNETEPARTFRYILQPIPISGGGFTQTVTDVDEFSLVNCITQDVSSNTGYSGLI